VSLWSQVLSLRHAGAPDAHSLPPQAGVQRYRFTPDQFEQLGRLGLFDHLRVELIGGEIIQMPPIGPEHGSTVDQTMQSLGRRLPAKPYYLRVQNPLRLGDSEPVPDVAIVPGKPSDYRTHHPTTALLVIEIADTSLEYDRTEKMSLYAAAGIPEYWIVNLGGAVRGGLSGACLACGGHGVQRAVSLVAVLWVGRGGVAVV
jgi:Uma2 family endonuclease